jgi:hypothetical protein
MNKLIEAGNAARKALLLATLEEHDWNLTRAAIALGISGPSNTSRELKKFAPKEYAKARKEGRITTVWKGNREHRTRRGGTP